MTDLIDAPAAGLQPGRTPGLGGTAPGERPLAIRSRQLGSRHAAAPSCVPPATSSLSRVVVFGGGAS